MCYITFVDLHILNHKQKETNFITVYDLTKMLLNFLANILLKIFACVFTKVIACYVSFLFSFGQLWGEGNTDYMECDWKDASSFCLMEYFKEHCVNFFLKF
jgi:hypothetical protein